MDSLKAAIQVSLFSSPVRNSIIEQAREKKPEDLLEICKQRGINKPQGHIALSYGQDPEKCVEKIIVNCKKQKIKITHFWHSDYPSLLKEICDPPLVLYYKGDLISNDCIAIVGARKAETSAAGYTARISASLCNAGLRVVSGLARGIDQFSHEAALKQKGCTIAVMPNGLDRIYPRENQKLYSCITNSPGSAVISELPPGIEGGRWAFVRRNRIISGLSLGTLVTQAAEKSGALITARFALEQNRDVFACPGRPFDDRFEGCNSLIRSGAVPVWDETDILKHLFHGFGNHNDFFKKSGLNIKTGDNIELSEMESAMCRCISSGVNDIDNLAEELNIDISEIQETLMRLELKGKISRIGNTLYPE